MKFYQRTKTPVKGNKWFTHYRGNGYSNCTTDLANRAFSYSTIHNCVGYCWGRYFEALAQNGKLWDNQKNIFAKRVNGNPPVAWQALKKSDYWKNYISSTPTVGSIAFYSKNSAPSKSGHVSFVEKVYDNGYVDFSNCNYSTRPLWAYQKKVNPKGSFGGYTLLGYLHPCVDKWNEKKTTSVNLRIRSGAGTGYNQIAIMPKGTVATVIGFDKDGWYNVRATVNGKSYEGWASGEYLK